MFFAKLSKNFQANEQYIEAAVEPSIQDEAFYTIGHLAKGQLLIQNLLHIITFSISHFHTSFHLLFVTCMLLFE